MEISEIRKVKQEAEEKITEIIDEFIEDTDLHRCDIYIDHETEYHTSEKGIRYLTKSQFKIILKI